MMQANFGAIPKAAANLKDEITSGGATAQDLKPGQVSQSPSEICSHE